MSGAPSPRPTRARHRWFKLGLHRYICLQCGAGRVNSQNARGQWIATWHYPDGRSVVCPTARPCAPGPHTRRYLQKYAEQIQEALRA